MPISSDPADLNAQSSSVGFLSKTALNSVTEEVLGNSHDRKLRG